MVTRQSRKNVKKRTQTMAISLFNLKNMKIQNKYSTDFLNKSYLGCLNNKSEILNGNLCGCYNCLEISEVKEIIEWIAEPNGGEDSAACPKCTFDSVLSSAYPIEDPEFLLEMRKYHFG